MAERLETERPLDHCHHGRSAGIHDNRAGAGKRRRDTSGCGVRACRTAGRVRDLIFETMTMQVARNKKDELVITISGAKDSGSLQRLTDYINYLVATENSKASQEEVDRLARTSGAKWWKKNRKRLLA